MKIYKGNKGIVGFIAFTLTGIIYSLFGISSKIVGKILFSIFVVLFLRYLNLSLDYCVNKLLA